MKKTLRLTALLALALLAGCGAQRTGESLSAPAPTEVLAVMPEPSGAADTAVETSPALTPESTPEPTPDPTPVPTPIAEEFPFEFTQPLADTEELGVTVTALGLDANGNWVFHLHLENRAAEILSIRFLYQSINGIAIEPFKYRLAVGEAAEREFRVFHEALESFGSSSPLEWAFTLRVTSAERNRKPFLEEPLRVCPFGEELVERFTYVPAEGDTILMNNDFITVYATGYSQEGDGFALEYVAVNKTDLPLRLQLDEDQPCLVNGREVSASLSDELGGYCTLIGYLPIEFSPTDRPKSVERLRFLLLLDDPTEKSNRFTRTVWVDLRPDYPLD